MNKVKEAFKELDEMAKSWQEDGLTEGGDVKEVSTIIDSVLKIAKKSHKLGYESISAVLVSLLIAIDCGPDDVDYIVSLLTNEYLANLDEENYELAEGELNLFNDDGTRVKMSDFE